MPLFSCFESSVLVGDLELPEYCVQIDHGTKTTTCWIPSEAGKEFKVKFRTIEPIKVNHDANMALAGFVAVDGKHCEGSGRPIGEMTCEPVYVSGTLTSATTSRSFMFSSIELTDDDRFLDPENMKNLGDICAEIRVVVIERLVTHGSQADGLDHDGKVHERSKKAMGHRVKFSAETEIPPTIIYRTQTVQTLATFVFKYRSMDILRAGGIAPPEPAARTVVGTKRKANDEDTQVDECDNDERELKILLAKVNEIQQRLENKGANPKPNKKVKKENCPVVISNEVIDLT